MITKKLPQTTFADLGWCMAKITICDNVYNNRFTIVCPEAEDEHTVTPAKSIHLKGINEIKALQKLLNDALPIDNSDEWITYDTEQGQASNEVVCPEHAYKYKLDPTARPLVSQEPNHNKNCVVCDKQWL